MSADPETDSQQGILSGFRLGHLHREHSAARCDVGERVADAADAFDHVARFEDEHLRDNPPNPDWRAGMSPARRLIRAHTIDQPEVHDAIAAMRRVADEYDDRVMIGEAYLPIDRLMAYYGVDLGGFHLPFNFHLISTPWQPTAISALMGAYERALPAGGWPKEDK